MHSLVTISGTLLSTRPDTVPSHRAVSSPLNPLPPAKYDPPLSKLVNCVPEISVAMSGGPVKR
ncbi:unnamed protein product [Protopolystoma xenopodis]|uniref:Uncharacterized protein n=1 Tax=Protopolystoma xenopodis TaxID=117903 RepID=A0A3S5FEF5_9PLAT|nr:unnamed protein product [Protopolystoma xenopodis]